MVALNPNRVDWASAPPEVEDDADEMDEPDTENAPAAPVRKFAHVNDWVTKYFLVVVRRRLNDAPGKGLSWDARWWVYPEVVARLMALHDAWEEASAAGGSAMSSWWINHLEPHLRVILDGDTGPMSHASPQQDFSGHPRFPAAAMPPQVYASLTRKTGDQTT